MSEQFAGGIKVGTERKHHSSESVASAVIWDMFVHARRLRPFPEVLVHVAEIDQCVEHMTVRGGIFLFRHPFYSLLWKRDINGCVCLLHHYGNIGLSVVNRNIIPFQISYIADSQSGKTGKQVGFLDKFIRAGSFHHAFDFINGQVFAFTFRLFYLFHRFH